MVVASASGADGFNGASEKFMVSLLGEKGSSQKGIRWHRLSMGSWVHPAQEGFTFCSWVCDEPIAMRTHYNKPRYDRRLHLVRRNDCGNDRATITLTFGESTMRTLLTLMSLTLCMCCEARGGEEPKAIPGIGPVGKIVKLHTNFKFTEGPVADKDGNVFFSDIPAQKIHRVDAKTGKLSTFVEKSNRSNGLKFNSKGELVACEMDGQVAAYSPEGKRRVVVDKYNDKRFNAPNDLVIDQNDGIYFTDPSFNAPKPWPQGKLGVYYASADGKVTRLIDDLPNPNGILLSIDEKTLYVIPTGQTNMMTYPVEAPGKIGKGKVFCTLKGGGGDGATIDTKGNLYITSTLGLQVFNPEGKLLGTIAIPEQPANVAFGGPDRKTLYVTARTSLYTVPMEASGHVVAKAK
jgi:gluconolactonase